MLAMQKKIEENEFKTHRMTKNVEGLMIMIQKNGMQITSPQKLMIENSPQQ